VWASKFTKRDQQLGKIRSIIDHRGESEAMAFHREDQLLAEVDVSDKFDFMEGNTQQVTVRYTGGLGGVVGVPGREELQVYMVDTNSDQYNEQGVSQPQMI